MKEIQHIHESVLVHLLNFKKDNPKFTFGFRKMNNSNRLKIGYWFNGDDNYVAIPFYTGRDWKNRTPNIFFKIGVKGHSFLEFSFSDSPEKLKIINNIKEYLYGIEENGRGYIKNYHTVDYLFALKQFLTIDKPIIDNIIDSNKTNYAKEKGYNKIDFYTETEFQKSFEKINKYRVNLNKENIGLTHYIESISIKSLSNNNIDIEINDIKNTARFIFLTGKNGTGKTTILKCISAALMGGKMRIGVNQYNHDIIPSYYDVKLNLENQKSKKIISLKNGKTEDFDENLIPFSAYGPYRNRISKELNLLGANLEKILTARSLFEEDAYMISLDSHLISQFATKEYNISFSSLTSELLQQIIDIIPALISNLVRIEVPTKLTIENLWSETQYVFEDEDQNEFPSVTFEELSSGHKSLIAFLCDMIIRLIWKQENVSSLSELSGIVIIDEIDLHLHPQYQKSLVKALADTFPDVQFIVSTHSPIPLLGAPENSIFLKVERKYDIGISVKRLKKLEKEIQYLLPNTILTSDIFDFNLFEDKSEEELEKIKFEDNYEDIELNKKVEERLNNIDKTIFPDKLFED